MQVSLSSCSINGTSGCLKDPSCSTWMYDPLVPIRTCPYVDTDKAIEHIEHHEKMHQSTAESQKELVLIRQRVLV